MRWPVWMLIAVGCGNRTPTGPTIGVTALAGDGSLGEAGATIVSSRADGTAIDEQVADATGRADIIVEPGAFISVVFPGQLDPIPTLISIATTPAPADGSDLVIHGPKHPGVPIVAAGLTVVAPPLSGATSYTIDLGCDMIAATGFPAVVNVIAPCEGTDTNLDILVRGYDATQTLVGYGAGREPIGTNLAGQSIAELDIATWETTGQPVPVTQDGVTAAVELDLVSDTLVFPTPPVTDTAQIWDGLQVDASLVVATIGSAVTTQYMPGAPTSIALASSDFLPAISPGLVLGDRATLAFQWADLDESAVGDVDALDLHVTWTNGPQLVWDAIVPPDISQLAFPTLDASLQQLIVLPADASIAVTSSLAAIDSSELSGFADLDAAGIFAGDTIVPAPTTGEIRTTTAAAAQ